MKISRSFVPVVKVEITFPCSQEEFMKVRQLFHKVSSLEKVESVLAEYGINEGTHKEPNVKVSRSIERTNAREEQLLKDLRAQETDTPLLDAMAAAGLGRLNISEIVRDYVRDNPGKRRSEIADELADKYKGKVARGQFYSSLCSQIQKKKIVSIGMDGEKRFYSSSQN